MAFAFGSFRVVVGPLQRILQYGEGGEADGVLVFAGVVLSPAAGAALMSVSTILVASKTHLLREGGTQSLPGTLK